VAGTGGATEGSAAAAPRWRNEGKGARKNLPIIQVIQVDLTSLPDVHSELLRLAEITDRTPELMARRLIRMAIETGEAQAAAAR
jgi:hypothetical protein